MPIHVTVPGSPVDARHLPEPPPGVIVTRTPPLRLDDVEIVDGIRVTAPSRTLIDRLIAEFCT